jgi:hypothetical protein
MERQARRLAMMLASLEERSIAIDETVTGNKVVVKHRRRAAAQVAGGNELELDLDPVLFGKTVSEVIEDAPVLPLADQSRTPDEYKILDIVVRLIRSIAAKHSAFATPIAAPEDDTFEDARREEAPQAFRDLVADRREPLFQFRTAVDGVAVTHAAR